MGRGRDTDSIKSVSHSFEKPVFTYNHPEIFYVPFCHLLAGAAYLKSPQMALQLGSC